MMEAIFAVLVLIHCVLVLATIAGLIIDRTGENFLYFVLLVDIIVISAIVAGAFTRMVFI